ncbi:MAG: ABC transporter permease [Bdellovibrionales bacterium]|nr:ABC transporter permease [Bdellovibrionales bacterium]
MIMTWLGRALILKVGEFLATFFLWISTVLSMIKQLLKLKFRARETLLQMYLLGVQSVLIMVVAMGFVGLMLIIELAFHMNLVLKHDSLVPAFSALLMVRELGPVITCLLLTSRIGAGIAAEIGSMKISEQLDALKMLSIDPIDYLVVPRWIGSVFAAVTLTVISLAIAIWGGAFLAAQKLGTSPGEYFNTVFFFVKFPDLAHCIVKSAVFGSLIPIVAAYQGFNCGSDSAAVGEAATQAVVRTSLYIIIADFLLTYLFYAI